MECQQFHLKWNNHSLNTLASFQQLLDSACLVDVSLTCSSGKVVPAHRMVLAACSDYFYRLFKDLPERHPVIVFKDASEEILSDLLEFMYRGEVEVDEANLSDFLKFADTLQVKGLSQGERVHHHQQQQHQHSSNSQPGGHHHSTQLPLSPAAVPGGWKQPTPTTTTTTSVCHQEGLEDSASSPSRPQGPPSLCATPPTNGSGTPREDTPPAISVKDPARMVAAAAAAAAAHAAANAAATDNAAAAAAAAANLNKAATAAAYHFTSALAAAGGHHQPKFPAFFHHPGMPNGGGTGDPAADLYAHLASPNLFNALKRKYPMALAQKQPSMGGFVVDPDSPVLKMPFLKDYFAKHPLDLSDAAARSAYANSLKEEDDDIAERQSPSAGGGGVESSPSMAGDHLVITAEDTKPDIGGGGGCTAEGKQSGGSGQERSGGGGRKPQGRGSRLERMIAAEYKILSEYSDPANGGAAPEALPAITPELMKSRRTHSLQLAIGEILHNRASVQSAATKYHIPRETLRRHYQRYLKAMGINNKEISPAAGGGRHGAAAHGGSAPPTTTTTKSSIETLAAAAALAGGGDEGSNYSSLLDIGQAYGLWNPGEDNSNDMSGPRDLKIVEEDDEDEEEEEVEEEEEDEEEVHSDDKENEEEVRASQGGSTGGSPLPAVRESQNNNNNPAEKSLGTARPVPLETL